MPQGLHTNRLPVKEAQLSLRADTVWRKTLVRLAFLAILCLGAPIILEVLAYRETNTQAHLDAREELDRLRVEIERLVNRDVQLVRGLVSYVQVRPNLGQAEFDAISSYLLSNDLNIIRNLALARGLVISHVFPLVPNRTVLGVDYRDLPNQLPMVMKAVEEDRVVLAGPLDLIQGGRGLIARFPIRIKAPETGQSELWGIASMVVDFDKLMMLVGIEALQERYAIAFTRIDEQTTEESIFLGSEEVLKQKPVSLEIALTGSRWGIHATPKNGWPSHSDVIWHIVVIAIIVFLVGTRLILVGMRFENALVQLAMQLESARKDADDARRTAEDANRAKTRFLANMSHELRTPLNAIIGFSEVMIEGLIGKIQNKKHAEYQKDIHASSCHLLDVINDILDITRIEAGEMELLEEELELCDVVSSSLRLTRTRAEEKAQTVTVDLADDLPGIVGDDRMLRQALINLIGNAIKFTPDRGRITISGSLNAKGGVDIVVEDNGRGISTDDLEHIMEPFTQASDSFTHANEGTGLGLSITKRLVEAHGGTLSLESELGSWTRVTLTLPPFRVGRHGS